MWGKQLILANWQSIWFKVSFGSTAPALSDREEFPYFFRTVMPDSSHNPARIAFIRRFKWDTVTTFSQNEEVHSLAVNDLVTELERANISCAATITFGDANFKDQLKILRVIKYSFDMLDSRLLEKLLQDIAIFLRNVFRFITNRSGIFPYFFRLIWITKKTLRNQFATQWK